MKSGSEAVSGTVYTCTTLHAAAEPFEKDLPFQIAIVVTDDGARMTARIEGDSNHLGHSLEDGHLFLFDECNDDECSVDITASIPAGVPVEIRTGSGDIGVDDLLGTLSLHTGSGDIEGWGLGGTDLVATTGSGDVDLAGPAR